MRPGLLAAGGVVALALSGCAGGAQLPAPDLQSRIDVDTPQLRSAKAEAGVRPCPEQGGPGSDLPPLGLDCLGGGRVTRLSDVTGPAVISLWASWCASCPDELPLFQRLSEEASDQVTVLGIDYEDTQPDAAMRLLDDTDAVFPQLADPGGDLADHYRVQALPGILFVDGTGAVTFMARRVDSYAELLGLVEDRIGVVVPAR